MNNILIKIPIMSIDSNSNPMQKQLNLMREADKVDFEEILHLYSYHNHISIEDIDTFDLFNNQVEYTYYKESEDNNA